MKTIKVFLIVQCFFLAYLTMAACSATMPQATAISPTFSVATPALTFSDPFAYCNDIDTIDKPDAFYTGEAIPNSVIDGYLKATGLENAGQPREILQQTTIWRCMDKNVYVCNFGANLPCNSKASTNKVPTQNMKDFCKSNPDSKSIPAAITGHSTVYTWYCVRDVPELLNQVDLIDKQGYLERIWYRLPTPENSGTP